MKKVIYILIILVSINAGYDLQYSGLDYSFVGYYASGMVGIILAKLLQQE